MHHPAQSYQDQRYARLQYAAPPAPAFQDPRWIDSRQFGEDQWSYQYPPAQPSAVYSQHPQDEWHPPYQQQQQQPPYPWQQFAQGRLQDRRFQYQQQLSQDQLFDPRLSQDQVLDSRPPAQQLLQDQVLDARLSAQHVLRDQQLLDQWRRPSQHLGQDPLQHDEGPEGNGGYPKKRRLLAEEEGEGTYELMENLAVGTKGGRKVLIENRNMLLRVPASVDDTVKFYNWLQSMRPPVEEVRNKDQVWEPLLQPATPMKLPESFLLRVRRGEQVARETQLMVPFELFESQRQQLLGHGVTNIAKSARITVEVEDCPENVLWKEEVGNKDVSTAIVAIEDLLVPSRPWVSEFRYLHFLLYESRAATVDEVVKMRSTRRKNQNDLELPYHPLLLCFCRGAASGQPEVNFFAEVHHCGAREDICLTVNGVSQPSEVKAAFQTALPGDPASGIYRNRSAFAKMLKCNTKDPQPWHLGFFAERIERLWFGFFEYTDNLKLMSIQVAPEFPYSDVWDRRNLLFDIRQLDKAKSSSTLRDVVTVSPQPGFVLLVRYVDTLCHRMGIPVMPIELVPDEVGDALDLTEAILVGQGPKSLVLRTGDNVTKVSKANLILHEQAIHAVVDGLDYVRPLVNGQHGVVEGAGDGLRWLTLRGFGRHLTQSDVSDIVNYDKLWRCGEKAVYGIHGKDVFHRDIKPANFLVVDGVLELNDFDASCFVDDSPEDLRQRVGTPHFESSFLKTNQQYKYRDDWCSLVLTFLYLHSAYVPGTNKQAAMGRALEMDAVPASLKACITWMHSTAAQNGNPRQHVTMKNEPAEQTRIKNEPAEQTRVQVKTERTVKRER